MNEPATEIEQCPLCSGTKNVITDEVQTASIVEKWRDYFQIDVAQYFPTLPDTIQLSCCQQCHLSSYSPFPLAAPAPFYVELAQKELDAYFTPEKWEFQQAVEDLRNCKNVLEIGYGSGAFLRLAQKCGIPIHGIELAPESEKNRKTENLPTIQFSLEELAETSSATYDGICSFQVLEHVTDPRAFIENACRLLKPGGTLALAVPNDDSYIKHQFNLLNLPPHHITRWNRRTFNWIADHFPLELSRWATEPLPKHLSHNYLDTWCEKKKWLGKTLPPAIRYQAGKALAQLGLHRLLQGQGIYVCFAKTANA